MGGALGEVPLRGNGLGRRCVPDPHPGVPADLEKPPLPWVAGQLAWRCSRGLAAAPTHHARGWPRGLSRSEVWELQ